ncbi:hypothetical protein CYMTET_11421 [Cymbomonas tetramitiformis]|nr:hypothetical protein CYMTET_25318 [Cymbomonas tetramitiformis]KAK3280758.1 hypothetical protein CYMTET_11421 [Cymbomonas tetramitiformis]
MVKSEEHCGALALRREVYVEQFLGQMSAITVNKVTAFPEKHQERMYFFMLQLNKLIEVCKSRRLQVPDFSVFREQDDSYNGEQCSLTKEVGSWQTISEATGSISAVLCSELQTEVMQIKRYRLFERATVGRQEIISSLNTTLGIKKSCYIVCRDLETYGEVAAFCEVERGLSDKVRVAIIHHFPVLRKEWHNQVAILDTTTSRKRAVHVQSILGRVGLVSLESGETRAMLVPRGVLNDLTLV